MGADLLLLTAGTFQGGSCTALLGTSLRTPLSSSTGDICESFLWSQRAVRKGAKFLWPPVSERRLGWILTVYIVRKTNFSCWPRKLVTSHPMTATALGGVWQITLGDKTLRPCCPGEERLPSDPDRSPKVDGSSPCRQWKKNQEKHYG